MKTLELPWILVTEEKLREVFGRDSLIKIVQRAKAPRLLLEEIILEISKENNEVFIPASWEEYIGYSRKGEFQNDLIFLSDKLGDGNLGTVNKVGKDGKPYLCFKIKMRKNHEH